MLGVSGVTETALGFYLGDSSSRDGAAVEEVEVSMAARAAKLRAEYGFVGSGLYCMMGRDSTEETEVVVACCTGGRGAKPMRHQKVLYLFPKSDIVNNFYYLHGRFVMPRGAVSPFFATVRYIHIAVIWEGVADKGLIECTNENYRYKHPNSVARGRTSLEALIGLDASGALEQALRSASARSRRSSHPFTAAGGGEGHSREGSRRRSRGRRVSLSPGRSEGSETSEFSSSAGRVSSVFRSSVAEEVGVLLRRLQFYDAGLARVAASIILYDICAAYGEGEDVIGLLSADAVKEGLRRPVAIFPVTGESERLSWMDAWGRYREGVRAIAGLFTVEQVEDVGPELFVPDGGEHDLLEEAHRHHRGG